MQKGEKGRGGGKKYSPHPVPSPALGFSRKRPPISRQTPAFSPSSPRLVFGGSYRAHRKRISCRNATPGFSLPSHTGRKTDPTPAAGGEDRRRGRPPSCAGSCALQGAENGRCPPRGSPAPPSTKTLPHSAGRAVGNGSGPAMLRTNPGPS